MTEEKKEVLVITNYKSAILMGLFDDGKPIEMTLVKASEEDIPRTGDIYIGRVQNVVKNIQAAFIEIGNRVPCYYSLGENPLPVYTKKIPSPNLVQGDELLVQVSKEGVKTKAPTVTSSLSFTGRYLVLTTGKTRIGASTKMALEKKAELKRLMNTYSGTEYGWIIRTNAGDATTEELHLEAKALIEQYETLKREAPYRTALCCMSKSQPAYLNKLRNLYQSRLLSVVTDDTKIYEEMKEFLDEQMQTELLSKLKFYEDKLLPLIKLYSMEQVLEQAQKERVWMKSGAYLVIEPTEALTVVDVNTGKYDGRKNLEETFLKINLEASKEVARQLRLRNISGIILVDFINMQPKEHKQILMNTLEQYLLKDPIKATLVDMTALGLMEITRKKVEKPLAEQVKDL